MIHLAGLRFRLALLVLLAIVPFVLLILFNTREQRLKTVESVHGEALRLAHLVAAEEQEWQDNTRDLLVKLAASPQVQDHDATACNRLLAELLKQNPPYANLGVIEPDGALFASAVPVNNPINLGDRSYFRLALKNREFSLGDYQMGRVLGKATICCGYPVLDGAGRVQRVVYASVDLSWLNNMIHGREIGFLPPIAGGAMILLIDRNGKVLISRHLNRGNSLLQLTARTPLIDQVLKKGDGTLEALDPNGKLCLFAFTPVPGFEKGGAMYLALGLPKESLFAESDKLLRRNLIGFVIGILLAVTLPLIFGNCFILNRIKALLNTTRGLALGNLTARTGLAHGPGELRELACAIDDMASALQRRESEAGQAKEALRRSEELFRFLIEHALDITLIVNRDATIRYVSPSIEQVSGFKPEALIGRSIREFIHQDDIERFMETLVHEASRAEGSSRVEYQMLHQDGSWRLLEGVCNNLLDTPAVTGSVVNARDITQRRQLEEQLHHSQKMESIGRLAGGVAHDFNNLLTVILGYTNLMLLGMDGQQDANTDKLQEIHKAAERAAGLTHQLLAFSRRQILQPRVLDFNAVIENLEKMIRRLIGEDIDLSVSLQPGLGRVKIDPGQMEQVLMNLVINARDAMPDGGRLIIRTEDVELDETAIRWPLDLKPGPYVALTVVDTGVGMDAATASRIFEPFFTTKERGKGTGLGLATAYGVVTQSEGSLVVESEPGKGTTFRIYLPQVVEEFASAEGLEPAIDSSRGTETILILEDEKAVRTLVRDVLELYGYTVLEAYSTEDALDMAEDYGGIIHLFVTDVILPRMSGRDVAEKISLTHPEVKVLFMSGYTDTTIFRHGVLDPGMAFLQKPFTPEVLVYKVRDVLNGAA